MWACAGPLPTLRNPSARSAHGGGKGGAGRGWLGVTEVLAELLVGRGCWSAGHILARPSFREKPGGDWSGAEKSPSIRGTSSIFDSSAGSVWQRWSMRTKCFSRRGWFEHRIPHPLWFSESECVEPNFAAQHSSLLFRFSWKPLYSPRGLGKDGNGGCKVLMKPVLLLWPTASLQNLLVCKSPFDCLSDQ